MAGTKKKKSPFFREKNLEGSASNLKKEPKGTFPARQ